MASQYGENFITCLNSEAKYYGGFDTYLICDDGEWSGGAELRAFVFLVRDLQLEVKKVFHLSTFIYRRYKT